MAKELWIADGPTPWQDVHQSYSDTVAQHASEKLQELNRWYESDLPLAVQGRMPEPHITQPELVQLVDWKLSRGKWRPRLLDFAKAAKEAEVVESSTKAFGILLKSKQSSPSPAAVQSALNALVVLKGVGPATASALLAAADSSGSTPFMSDEALEAAVGSRSYTAKEYLQLVEALRGKADRLNSQDPDAGWTAVKVERCLYAADLARKGGAKGSSKAAKPTKAAAAATAGKGESRAKAVAAPAGPTEQEQEKQQDTKASLTQKRPSKEAATAASEPHEAAGPSRSSKRAKKGAT